MITTIILCACALLCLFIFKKLRFRETTITIGDLPSLPEVPGSLPLFGHLLYLGSKPGPILMKWAAKYGKMFMVNFGPLK